MPTSALGLYRTPNPLGGAQNGGYRELRNCVIRSKDVVEPRRGQFQVSSWIGTGAYDTRRINALASSSLGVFAQYGADTSSGIVLLGDSGFGSALLTDVDPPSPWVRTKFADCMKRCYATSDSGLKRIDSSSAAAAAGGPRAVTCIGHNAQFSYDASGFLAADSACMYRAELVNFAPDGAEIVGPPTARAIVRASSDKTTGATGVARLSNITTVTTLTAHGFKVGQTVNAAFDAADTGAGKFTNGTKIVATVPSSTTFTIADSAADYTSTVASTWSAGPAKLSGLKVFLPSSGISTATVIRLYRSEQVTPAGGTPPDDVYKVYEAKLDATSISNGFIVLADNTPEVLLGNPSYFSPSVEGEGQANETPPLAWDVAALGDTLYAFNLLDPHRLELRLISTGGSVGIVENTTITIARGASTFTCTAETSAFIYGNGEFVAYTGGTVARDIELTAQSLCDAINGHSSNTFCRAMYISQSGDAPGTILIEAEDFSTTAITAVSDKGSAWAPNILNTGTATASTQIPDYAGIAWSKAGQPDAWPASQRARAGSPSEYGLRILALRDKLIALKEKTAHLVAPSGGAIRIDPLDDSCEFPLPDTAAVLDNQVFVLSSMGVVSVSEGGVANMGSPIEGEFRSVLEQALRTKALLGTYATTPALASWGAADELEHRYLLAVPSLCKLPSSGSTLDQTPQVDSIWVYNSTAKAWSGPWPSSHRHAATWSGASSSGRLVFARSDKPGVLKEQGSDAPEILQFSDYLGESKYASGITNGSLAVTLIAGLTDAPDVGTVEVGDALYNSTTGWYSIVTSITSRAAGTITVHSTNGLANNTSYVVLKRYRVRAEPVPMGEGFPAERLATAFNLALSNARFQTASVYVGNERSGDRLAKTLSRGGFGSGTFGEAPFGDGPGLHKERGQATIKGARGNFTTVALETDEAGAFFRLHALSVDTAQGSPKGER